MEGDYTFYLTTDAGASLRIHEALVVDDDFQRTGGERSGTIKLASGLHPLRLSYRHKGGEPRLQFQYEGPGIPKQEVPANACFVATQLASPRVSGKLLDDPTWLLAPEDLETGSDPDRWRWESPGVSWETSPANTGNNQDSFDAGTVTFTNRPSIVVNPSYVPGLARLRSITPAWETNDFVHVTSEHYDPTHVLHAWYTVTIENREGECFTGSSSQGGIHHAPLQVLNGNDHGQQAALVSAWNAPLVWDRDPFAGGGILLADIEEVQVTFFAETESGNGNATGKTLFRMMDSGVYFEVDMTDAYTAWASSHGLVVGNLTEDSDLDSVPDLLEYAFNLNPTNRDERAALVGQAGWPRWKFPPEVECLEVEFLRRKNDPALRYETWFSDQLRSGWSSGPSLASVSPVNGGWERVRIVEDVEAGERPSGFGMMSVERTP